MAILLFFCCRHRYRFIFGLLSSRSGDLYVGITTVLLCNIECVPLFVHLRVYVGIGTMLLCNTIPSHYLSTICALLRRFAGCFVASLWLHILNLCLQYAPFALELCVQR